MGILDQIMQMRSQGVPDQDIISQLQESGIPPKAINDALNQANIKSAVGGEETQSQGYGDDYTPVPSSETYVPKTEEYSGDFYMPQEARPSQYPVAARPSQAYQEFYPQEQGYAEMGTDADTMVEIAQQVFSEKIKKIQQQIEELNEFKTLYQTKVDSIYERLKKIEGIIDRLQAAILEKIGSYGEGIEGIKKELSMMQGTYGKIAGAIAEKHHATRITHHTAPAHVPPTRPKHKTHHVKAKTSKKSAKRKR